MTLNVKSIAILTCEGLNEYKIQDTELIDSLSKIGLRAEHVIWDKSPPAWNQYQAVVISTTWDYTNNSNKYNLFLKTVTEIKNINIKLFNSYETILWNIHKKYLRDLSQKEVPIIDTIWLKKTELKNLSALLASTKWTNLVIKPTISAAGMHTMRFSRDQTQEMIVRCAQLDVDEWMVQPFASEIIDEGEYSFIYLGNEFSHCVLKKPREGDFLTGAKNTPHNSSFSPSADMLNQAQKIIDICAKDNLVTRLDGIRQGNTLVVMEIEMIEPYLYLEQTSDFGSKHARVIANKLRSFRQPAKSLADTRDLVATEK